MNREIVVDGVTYIPKTETVLTGYTMTRTEKAGVFYGIIKARDGDTLILKNARRVWYWEGAATLSELATRGTSCPDKCKFPCPVEEVTLHNVIEEIPVSEVAKITLDEVMEWTMH